MDLVCPTGVVAEAIHGERQVSLAAIGDRLAIVEGFESGGFVKIFLDQVYEPVHEPAALTSVHRVPGAGFKRGASRFDGFVDVRRVSLGDFGDDFLGGGIDRFERFSADGVDPLAIDESLSPPTSP